jgi:hypothetical protein
MYTYHGDQRDAERFVRDAHRTVTGSRTQLRKNDEKKHMIFENMCHCQISTLEVTNDSFKFIAKSPVFNCPTCGYKGYSTLKNDA